MSQRSTRFVDECDSDWHPHPLLWGDADLLDDFNHVRSSCNDSYRFLANTLETKLKAKGFDAQTARKQARGAARGVLGNALETQMIYTASLEQWKLMLRQRMNRFADAEIRLLFNTVYPQLTERYPSFFTGWKVGPSPDGMGEVLLESP